MDMERRRHAQEYKLRRAAGLSAPDAIAEMADAAHRLVGLLHSSNGFDGTQARSALLKISVRCFECTRSCERSVRR
jgi:hypothetical protein